MSIPPLPLLDDPDPGGTPDPAVTVDPERLQMALREMRLRLRRLELENAALAYSAESFGALAERLNTALRQMRG